MHVATATESPPVDAHLGTAEISAAFDALSSDDRLKLAAIEAYLLGGTGLDQGDLLHEAFCRALSGRRKCPAHVPFMAFLVETMKSLASHCRESYGRSVSLSDSPGGQGGTLNVPDSFPDVEDQFSHASILEDVYRQFSDDEEAMLVLMGWADGLRGAPLREATGLHQSALDYAIKRIRIRVRKLYPNGLTHE